jgi:quercetin dioxygenase-like cupin family protein
MPNNRLRLLMNAEARLFSVADFEQPSEEALIRSVVQETAEAVIVVWHILPGQEIPAHAHPHGQDTWTVLSGTAEYYKGHGENCIIKANDIAVARANQIHGAKNLVGEPFVFVSVVTPASAGYNLAEK